MEVYRISKTKYAKDLSGVGAKMYGGRWNSKGVSMLYTSQSRALAMAEVAVHLSFSLIPKDFSITTIEIPDKINVKELDTLPNKWDNLPHIHATQQLGDAFIYENQFLALRAPSVIVKGDFNYLLNPKHDDFNLISIVDVNHFSFDKRLLKK